MEQRNKILHLIIDHQVIERSLGIFETLYPGQNEVLIFEKKDRKYHEKSIIRPTFSYLGNFYISDKVIKDGERKTASLFLWNFCKPPPWYIIQSMEKLLENRIIYGTQKLLYILYNIPIWYNIRKNIGMFYLTSLV